MKDDHGCHRCGRSLSDCRCQQEDAASVPRTSKAITSLDLPGEPELSARKDLEVLP